MKITVCELQDDPQEMEMDWKALTMHVREQASDLVLLPEMPFFTWLPRSRVCNHTQWMQSVKAHEEWIERLAELSTPVVCGTIPVVVNGRRHNEAFIWEADSGFRLVHTKYYLPDEGGFWEATWYDRGIGRFTPTQFHFAKAGFMICTEMWFTEHARSYAKQKVQLLMVPRATEIATTEKWLAGGRAAAIMSGAFCLSSNRGGFDAHGYEWGGHGWVIEPDQGLVLATTSRKNPFLTLDIDLSIADNAKFSYPRYVPE